MLTKDHRLIYKTRTLSSPATAKNAKNQQKITKNQQKNNKINKKRQE